MSDDDKTCTDCTGEIKTKIIDNDWKENHKSPCIGCGGGPTARLKAEKRRQARAARNARLSAARAARKG